MKKIIFLILLLAGFQMGYAQVKILFDASKAETAGNADWVIDADLHNLGYNPGPYIGGHESNAQKTPSPSQSNITSGTSQNYWTGAISAWAIDAVKQGYEVETLPYNGNITYNNTANPQDLSNYKIFVVCEPNILFTSAEKTAIVNFVNDGGGLFMVSDHDNSDRNGDGYDSPAIWNDLIKNNSVQNYPFGFTFDYEYFSDNTTNIPSLPGDPLLHGSYGNVTRVEFYGGTSLTLNPLQNSSVKGVVYRTGFSNTGHNGVLCAYATYGQGRVVAIGDSSPADDGTGDPGDNLYDGWIQDANGNHERLFMNATIWLAENTTGIHTGLQNDITLEVSSNGQFCNFTITGKAPLQKLRLDIYDIMGRVVVSRDNLQLNYPNRIVLQHDNLYIYKLSGNNQIVKTGKLFF